MVQSLYQLSGWLCTSRYQNTSKLRVLIDSTALVPGQLPGTRTSIHQPRTGHRIARYASADSGPGFIVTKMPMFEFSARLHVVPDARSVPGSA
eukprot:1544491-Rhodomonas_salina.6